MNTYNGYISAEITLFWTAETENHTGQLIFAVTELIPKGQMASAPLGGGQSKYLCCNISQNHKAHIYCRRFFCDVDQAVLCFEAHDWSSLPDGPQIDTCSSFKREPAIGMAVVLSKGHTPLNCQPNSLSMILPNRSASFRTYCYMDQKSETEKHYSTSEIGKIRKFIKKLCGVDLEKYNEYIGANIICMQNPLLWSVQIAISEDKKTYRFLLMPRARDTVNSVYATIRSSHSFGTVSSKLINIKSEVFEFPIQESNKNSELCLWDIEGNLLEIKPLQFFQGKLWTSMNYRTLPNGEKVAIWPQNYYRSQRQEDSAIEKAERARSYRLLESKREFCYFCAGEGLKAQNFIGSILASTGLQIKICDPYLDRIGLDKFIKGWIRCNNLYLFVSNEWLVKSSSADKKTHQEEIEQTIEEMISKQEIQQAQLFGIMGGNNGFVHDRFIIVDNNVWCLGTSFNNLGDKDTVIVKSPNPQAFIGRVKEWEQGKTPLIKEWKK